jgi:polyisoprenoid-binding protein YceI
MRPLISLVYSTASAIALSLPVLAEPATWTLDASHSQIVFSYDHMGYSTNWGMFSGFGGTIEWNEADPASSSVVVAFPVRSMLTGWEARFEHFMSPDFFGAAADEMVEFRSTAIEVTGDTTARITGDLTLNGVTRPVVLDAVLNQAGPHPMEGKPWAGFGATATLVRSDFGLGLFAPFVSDEVQVQIQIEAFQD